MPNMTKVLSRFILPAAALASLCLGEFAPAQSVASSVFGTEFSPADETQTSPQQQQQQTQQRGRGGGRFGGRIEGVYKSQVTPNWFANNTKLWYRNDLGGGA